MASSGGLNPFAQSGFAKSAAYDQHRPSFPSESVNLLLENIRLEGNKNATVVDLAAGTGKFTELLAKRDEAFDITAVEPHADMRRVLEEKKLPGVQVKDGLSTSMPFEDESVDAVIAAQAFHWFANMDSLREIHRVLQMHGALGLIWNVEDYNSPRDTPKTTSWEQKLNDFVWTLDDSAPRFRHEQWRKVFDEQIRSTPLTVTLFANPLFALPLGEHVEKWTAWLTKEALWERYSTLGQIAVLEGDEKEKAYSVFQDAMRADDVETNEKGQVALHGMTLSVWTTKVPV